MDTQAEMGTGLRLNMEWHREKDENERITKTKPAYYNCGSLQYYYY